MQNLKRIKIHFLISFLFIVLLNFILKKVFSNLDLSNFSTVELQNTLVRKYLIMNAINLIASIIFYLIIKRRVAVLSQRILGTILFFITLSLVVKFFL